MVLSIITTRGIFFQIFESWAANNHYTALDSGGQNRISNQLPLLFWGSGRAVDSGRQKIGFESSAVTLVFFSNSESPGPSYSGVQASPTVHFFFHLLFLYWFSITSFFFASFGMGLAWHLSFFSFLSSWLFFFLTLSSLSGDFFFCPRSSFFVLQSVVRVSPTVVFLLFF